MVCNIFYKKNLSQSPAKSRKKAQQKPALSPLSQKNERTGFAKKAIVLA